MSDLHFYPKHPPTVGTVLLSCYKLMYHVNEIPRARVPDAIEKSKDIFDGAKGDLDMIRGWLALQLSDAPVEPMLGADENRKGSVLGLVSLACALHERRGERKSRRRWSPVRRSSCTGSPVRSRKLPAR
jgi:hypothetical protein